MTEPTIAVGEPIDPDDVTPICPRQFGRLCIDTAGALAAIEAHEREIERITREQADTLAVLDSAGAEVKRLRGLLAEALTGWETSEQLRCADTHSHEGLCTDRRIAEVRREAGLA